MAALTNRTAQFVASPPSGSSLAGPSPWIADDAANSGARARDLQAQLKADLYTGRLKQAHRPARYSPARGIVMAVVPSAALWWGIISAISYLSRHAH